MKKPFPTSFRYFIAVAISGLTACSPSQAVKNQPAFDFSQAGQIELQISGADANVPLQDVSEKVSQNLNQWHYPVGLQRGKPASHRLQVRIGAVEHTKTPTGFSFSMGNSDPRAANFQKADVLPISCELTAIAHPEQSREFNMGFPNNLSGKQLPNAEQLADRISTVCFNLLHEVKWPLPVPANKSELQKSSWIPQIQIETKELPTTQVNKAGESKTVAAKSAEVKEDLVNTQKTATETTEKKAEEIEVRTSETAGETKKQIIIHNMGAPLILEMGHQRR